MYHINALFRTSMRMMTRMQSSHNSPNTYSTPDDDSRYEFSATMFCRSICVIQDSVHWDVKFSNSCLSHPCEAISARTENGFEKWTATDWHNQMSPVHCLVEFNHELWIADSSIIHFTLLIARLIPSSGIHEVLPSVHVDIGFRLKFCSIFFLPHCSLEFPCMRHRVHFLGWRECLFKLLNT